MAPKSWPIPRRLWKIWFPPFPGFGYLPWSWWLRARVCSRVVVVMVVCSFAFPGHCVSRRGPPRHGINLWKGKPGMSTNDSPPAKNRAKLERIAAIRLPMRMRILMRPENLLANFGHKISKKKLRIKLCELKLLGIANGFANEVTKKTFSLRKFSANGRLRRNSLAIAKATAWCTQQ